MLIAKKKKSLVETMVILSVTMTVWCMTTASMIVTNVGAKMTILCMTDGHRPLFAYDYLVDDDKYFPHENTFAQTHETSTATNLCKLL